MLFEIIFVIHGYYVYQDIWEVEISSELPCLPEPDNYKDYHAVEICGICNQITVIKTDTNHNIAYGIQCSNQCYNQCACMIQ